MDRMADCGCANLAGGPGILAAPTSTLQRLLERRPRGSLGALLHRCPAADLVAPYDHPDFTSNARSENLFSASLVS
ncbi:MAG: hypothetical protein BGO99_14305 [Nitrosospira sp. 56-18]|nr:MAG: hypothetical protein BGO99_14305 [Nitrosospira sp. 56-18]